MADKRKPQPKRPKSEPFNEPAPEPAAPPPAERRTPRKAIRVHPLRFDPAPVASEELVPSPRR